MHYTRLMGVAAPELEWVPSPTYILRRAAILDWLRGYPPGRVLEMGCGPGALLHELARRGFHGVGVELSERSRRVAGQLLGGQPEIQIRDRLPTGEKGSFDYLFAFEVLEHIEDDVAALSEWLEYLRPGGTLFISVPAHRAKWNVTDLFAGHFRRYERDEVLALLERTGLEPLRIGTYGWPVTRLIEWLRVRSRQRELRQQGIDPDSITVGDEELTKSSGVDRQLVTRLYRIYGSLPGRLLFRLAMWLQRRFYRTSLGISFIAVARKAG
jgi:SAM-dependent methyltransferase